MVTGIILGGLHKIKLILIIMSLLDYLKRRLNF